jgi:uracil-DNA glycosylase
MTSDPLNAQDAGELVAWYADMGITEALDDVAHDRFVETATEAPLAARLQAVENETPPSIIRRELPQRATTAAPPRRPDTAATIAPDAAALEARDVARKAASLEELQGLMAAFEGCALKATASSLCFADGNPKARLMLVGEAPGAEEDRSGLPFVGRSGQLLDAMLAAIGLKRASDVYIANVVPWRPPGNRTPTPQEVAICLPFIQRQIALVNPDILVCIGAPSAQALLGINGILASRGKWTEYDTGQRKIRAMAMLHPAYILRQPLQKRLAWRDFRALKAALAGLS